MEQAYLLNANS